MSTQVTAAVARPDGPRVETLTLEDPRPGEALVRYVATGLCHTDLDVMAGNLPTPRPVVAGHEGVGIVEAVGDGVDRVSVGDRVLVSIDSCGTCRACVGGHLQYCDEHLPRNFLARRADGSVGLRDAGGEPVHDHFFGQSSLATHGLAAARSMIRIDSDIADAALAPMACGAITGAGAVSCSGLRPGGSVVVLGAGTVGLSAIMTAAAGGAGRIVAVDLVPSRLQLAAELGATDVLGGVDDLAATLVELTGGAGFDLAIESSGAAALMGTAAQVIGNLGEAVILGFASMTEQIPVPVFDLLRGKSVRGLVMGHRDPAVLVDELLRLHAAGRFPVDKLVTCYPLTGIDRAVADVRSGPTVKAVLDPWAA